MAAVVYVFIITKHSRQTDVSVNAEELCMARAEYKHRAMTG